MPLQGVLRAALRGYAEENSKAMSHKMSFPPSLRNSEMFPEPSCMGVMSNWSFTITDWTETFDHVDYEITTHSFGVMAQSGEGRRFYLQTEWVPKRHTTRAREVAEAKAQRYADRMAAKGDKFDPENSKLWDEGQSIDDALECQC